MRSLALRRLPPPRPGGVPVADLVADLLGPDGRVLARSRPRVVEMVRARHALGEVLYGTPLAVPNGRCFSLDGLHEALDLTGYLVGADAAHERRDRAGRSTLADDAVVVAAIADRLIDDLAEVELPDEPDPWVGGDRLEPVNGVAVRVNEHDRHAGWAVLTVGERARRLTADQLRALRGALEAAEMRLRGVG